MYSLKILKNKLKIKIEKRIRRGCGFQLIPIPSLNKILSSKLFYSFPWIKNLISNYPQTLPKRKKEKEKESVP